MKLPKLLVSGFNGFGQFKNVPTEVLTSFTEWDYKSALELAPNNDIVTHFQIISKFSYTAISIDNSLYIFGSINGEFHQLRCHQFTDNIQQIAGNDIYTIILANGDVHKLEINSNSLKKLSFLNVDNKMPTKIIETVHGIQSGGTFTIAMTSNNEVYSIPSKIHTFPKHVKVKKICCGAEHTLILSKNGDVYTFGSSARGQLGLGSLETVESPVLVDALAGIKIVDIAAGYWHSAAVSVFGDLYEWGWNYNGQMGRPVYKSMDISYTSGRKETIKHKLQSVFTSPEIIDLSPDKDLDNQWNVCKVFAGHRHTIVLTECGTLLGCGWNRYGQLGKLDTETDVVRFEQMDSINIKDGNKLVDIVCGDWCTILVINCDLDNN